MLRHRPVVARLGGTEVRAHPSLALILFFVAVGLAAGELPRQTPGAPTGAYVVAGFAGAVILFVAIAAHEFGHVVAARRVGVETGPITLSALGGITELESEPASPRDMITVALAGPAVNLALAGALACATVAIGRWEVAPLTETICRWAAGANLALGLWNLVPAPPLDGARVLQGLLWARRGDRLSATLAVAKTGRVCGWLAFGIGGLQMYVGAVTLGLLLAIVGAFMVRLATAEVVERRAARASLG